MTSERIPAAGLRRSERKMNIAVCEACDWAFLVPERGRDDACPHCARGRLAPTEPSEALPVHPPELIVPFAVTADSLADPITAFSRAIPYPPSDLKPEILAGRLVKLFLPTWLVDVQVDAVWQAEAGFDYEVVSHEDHFDENAGGWSSREVNETRVRWEPRVGRLDRSYENLQAPALEEDAALRQALGASDRGAPRDYSPEIARGAFIRLPNRSTEDAWPEAAGQVKALAAEECRRAASADHLREFRWKPEFKGRNWTGLLEPVYATHYLDDDAVPRPVLINGRTGTVTGARRASMKRAKRASVRLLIAAGAVFVASLLLSLAAPGLKPLSGVAILLAFVLGLFSPAPVIRAWRFNRTRPPDPHKLNPGR